MKSKKLSKKFWRETKALFNKEHSFTLKSIEKYGVFHLKHVIFYQGRLYERLPKSWRPRSNSHGFRVILNSDDYDYVTDRNLRRRLERAFKACSK
jgi:hypothetical protein